MRQDAMTSKKVQLSINPLSPWERSKIRRGGVGVRASSRVAIIASLSLLAAISLSACSSSWMFWKQQADMPDQLISPYPGPKLWAVVPMRNESGTSLVDSASFADKLTAAIHETQGIDVVPVNRVIEAMNSAQMTAVTSVDQAMQLMQLLKVDGLVVGTVTDWDPYEPPKIGATIQLYSRRNTPGDSGLDTRKLTYAATDSSSLPEGTTRYSQPVATASDHFDAANEAVRARLQHFADGRAPSDSPAGWRRYLLNMDLYTEFVSYELTRELLLAERQRLWGQPQFADAKDKVKTSP
jgi:hypothetical protein